MYEWTEPYENTYLLERMEQVMKVQRELSAKGQLLVSAYEQLWLPIMNELSDVVYHGQERYSAPYGSFGPILNHPFHGALAFTPQPGAQLPDALTGGMIDLTKPWQDLVQNLLDREVLVV